MAKMLELIVDDKLDYFKNSHKKPNNLHIYAKIIDHIQLPSIYLTLKENK